MGSSSTKRRAGAKSRPYSKDELHPQLDLPRKVSAALPDGGLEDRAEVDVFRIVIELLLREVE